MTPGRDGVTPAPLHHQPALDGIRALAVAAVMLFHGGVDHARAGFLGVDVFFVLSGFLITYLLLREIAATGRVDAKAFWLRRARRLLPALFLVLVAVAVFGATVATRDEALDLRGDVFGSLLYVQNWRLVLSGQPYFAQFGSPSPLRHMWSLAIEEQWYLIWPLVFLGIVKLANGRLRVVGATVLALAAASALLMAALWEPGGEATRVYYGTDTRAQALLIGAALAVLLAATGGPRRAVARGVAEAAGFAGLAFLVWVVVVKDEAWDRLYRGGFSLVALAAAAVILAALQPGAMRRLLSMPPLPAIGLISYGLYLWHWPVDVFLSPARTGLDGWTLFALRTAVAIAVATASFVLVERPIREQRVRWARHGARWVPVAAGTTAVALVALTATGAAAQPREHIPTLAEFTRLVDRPPPPGSLRTLVVGDSIAFTLVQTPVPLRLDPPIWLRAETTIGCGIFDGTPYSDGRAGSDQASCAEWPVEYRMAVRETKPDLALVLLGGWEVYDREVGGTMLRFGTPEMEQALRTRLDRARRILTADGATFGLLTTPCFHVEERDLGQWGEAERADPSRTVWLNQVWRRYVADHPGTVLVDLDSITCPGGRYQEQLDGARVRTDGVHFTRRGADAVWARLGPLVHAAVPTR
jgi:peptidoglycan/LPS O-acetylase OafA/YrhL